MLFCPNNECPINECPDNDVYCFSSWFEIPEMHYRRYSAASSVDNNDNLWVIGGYQVIFSKNNAMCESEKNI